jgi:hypothetical protein
MTYLRYITPTTNIKINNPNSYKIATPEEINQINEYSSIIKQIAHFYETNLSNSKIDYVYKENNSIQILPVKYKCENFPHLTGINFDRKSAKEKFNYLKYGYNETPIIIERNKATLASSAVLTQLRDIKQAQRINFSRGIKDSNNELLLALQNFQPEFYQPKSLLNISKKNAYQYVPENTVLGIFKEQPIRDGIHIEPISLNRDSLDNIAITTEMLISMKKYADSINRKKH